MQVLHQFVHPFIIEKRSAFHRDQFSEVSIFDIFIAQHEFNGPEGPLRNSLTIGFNADDMIITLESVLNLLMTPSKSLEVCRCFFREVIELRKNFLNAAKSCKAATHLCRMCRPVF